MKIIKITTENEITTLEFPEGDITSVNKRLYEMIGPKCELMEHVMPSRLYKILGASNRPKKEKGSCTSILMDEEAYYHRNLSEHLMQISLRFRDLIKVHSEHSIPEFLKRMKISYFLRNLEKS